MARTSRRKNNNFLEWLKKEYSEYQQEYFKNCKDSDFNGENVLTFEQWNEYYGELNNF